MHNSRVVFIDLEVVSRDDAFEDEGLGAHIYDFAGGPAESTLLVVLDPEHLLWKISFPTGV